VSSQLSVRWPGKIEKQGGKVFISFFLQGSLLEGKSISLPKFFLFRCVFEAMLMVKVNLGLHKLFWHKVHVCFRCLVIVFVWIQEPLLYSSICTCFRSFLWSISSF
jgi:hypothetical protein